MSKKIILGIFGALFLAIISNAIYDLAFKPTLGWAASLIVNVSTLGISRIRDAMYIEAIVGRDGFSSALLMLPVSMLTTMVSLVTYVSAGRIIYEIPRLARLRYGIFLIVFSALFVALLLLIFAVRQTYIVRIAMYVERLQRASAPYLSESERLMLDSSLAIAASRDDVSVVVDRYHNVLSKNKIVIARENLI